MSYIVTRQKYWPNGDKVVEITSGGRDSIGPDALVEKYPGEWEEFDDPNEALDAARIIHNLWYDVDKDILGIGIGDTWGGSLPLEPTDPRDEALDRWAKVQFDALERCDHCGEIFRDNERFCDIELGIDFGMFCSEYCCAEAYEKEINDE